MKIFSTFSCSILSAFMFSLLCGCTTSSPQSGVAKAGSDIIAPTPIAKTTQLPPYTPLRVGDNFIVPDFLEATYFERMEQLKESRPAEYERLMAQSALMYINHINYVIARLGKMGDIMALQQEYENLTDCNLNLNVINHARVKDLIKNTMAALTDITENNINYNVAKLKYHRKKSQAIWKALPSPHIFIVGGRNQYETAALLATTVAMATISSVQNYFNAVAEAENEYLDTKYELLNKRLQTLDDFSQELLDAQWQLVKKYNLADEARIDRNTCRIFLEMARIFAPKNVRNHQADLYTGYKVFREREGEVANLPFYWITRVTACQQLLALLCDATRKAKLYEDLFYSCEKYFSLYRDTPIIRKDSNAYSMALLYVGEYISYKMDVKNAPLSSVEKESIGKWLRFIEANVRISDWQTRYAVALIYQNTLDNKQKAKSLIESAYNEMYICLKIYSDDGNNIYSPITVFGIATEKLTKDDVDELVKGMPKQKADLFIRFMTWLFRIRQERPYNEDLNLAVLVLKDALLMLEEDPGKQEEILTKCHLPKYDEYRNDVKESRRLNSIELAESINFFISNPQSQEAERIIKAMRLECNDELDFDADDKNSECEFEFSDILYKSLSKTGANEEMAQFCKFEFFDPEGKTMKSIPDWDEEEVEFDIKGECPPKTLILELNLPKELYKARATFEFNAKGEPVMKKLEVFSRLRHREYKLAD